jgi:hypothetical protein
VNSYEFFSLGEEGYDRDLAELTLHQLMRRVVRLLEQQINKSADKCEAPIDETLLQVDTTAPILLYLCSI